jgi:hypothetical protein
MKQMKTNNIQETKSFGIIKSIIGFFLKALDKIFTLVFLNFPVFTAKAIAVAGQATRTDKIICR